MQDFTENLAVASISSKIHLVMAYYHIPVAPEDTPKTAVATSFVLFEIPCMPFGLRNAAPKFQKHSHQVYRGLHLVFLYVDVIFVAGPLEQERHCYLRLLFDRLQFNGLVINAEKCVFGASHIEFLSQRITPEYIQPLEANVKTIRNIPQPSSFRTVREFLGLLNFHRRFIPGCAHLLKPLTDLLRGSKSSNNRVRVRVRGGVRQPHLGPLEDGFEN